MLGKVSTTQEVNMNISQKPSELDFVHYEGKQIAYSSRLNKRD